MDSTFQLQNEPVLEHKDFELTHIESCHILVICHVLHWNGVHDRSGTEKGAAMTRVLQLSRNGERHLCHQFMKLLNKLKQ